MKKIKKYNFNFDIAIKTLETECKGYICYRRELKLYKEILNSIEGTFYVLENEFGKRYQYFEAKFGEISETSGLEYLMIWDIQKAEKLIKEKNLIPIDLLVENFISSFNEVEINKEYGNKYNPNPIIIAKGPHNEDIIIDGNHRMYYAKKNKVKTIKAYILNVEESIDCIFTEEFKKIFKIHINLMKIAKKIVSNDSLRLTFTDKYEDGKLYCLHNKIGSYFLSKLLLFFEI